VCRNFAIELIELHVERGSHTGWIGRERALLDVFANGDMVCAGADLGHNDITSGGGQPRKPILFEVGGRGRVLIGALGQHVFDLLFDILNLEQHGWISRIPFERRSLPQERQATVVRQQLTP
jgi:hypothetical protein